MYFINDSKLFVVSDEPPTATCKEIVEEILFVWEFDNIIEMREWLRDVWEAAISAEVDCATVSHRKF